jgi:hypothetical protein
MGIILVYNSTISNYFVLQEYSTRTEYFKDKIDYRLHSFNPLDISLQKYYKKYRELCLVRCHKVHKGALSVINCVLERHPRIRDHAAVRGKCTKLSNISVNPRFKGYKLAASVKVGSSLVAYRA